MKNKILDSLMYLVIGLMFATLFIATMLGEGNKGLIDLF